MPSFSENALYGGLAVPVVTGATPSIAPEELAAKNPRQIAREDAVRMCLPLDVVPNEPKVLGGFAPNMLPPVLYEPEEPCELEPGVGPNIELPVLLGLLPNVPPLPKVLVPVPPKVPNPDAGLGAPKMLELVVVGFEGPNAPVGLR